jgi:hypothetical protein
MRMIHVTLATVLLGSMSLPAFAAASAEEASRILAGLQKYLGHEAGVVTVTPQGDDYELILDFKPYITKAATPDLTAEITPLHIKLTPQGDGKWLASQDEALGLKLSIKDIFTMDAQIGSNKWSGLFDEAAGGFLNSTMEMGNIAFVQDQNDVSSGMSSHT